VAFQPLKHALDHVAVEAHAELEALGGCHELARQQDLAGLRVDHAQQYLEAPPRGVALRAQRRDALALEREPVLLERGA
jgi:hypothetical protein